MSSWPFGVLLEQVRLARLKFPEPTVGVPDSLAADALPRRALAVAYAEVGKGELPGPPVNRGPDVAKWCAPHGDGHQYCGGFAGWCYEEAAREEGVLLPFERSLGAKRLGKNLAAVGRRFDDWRDAEPGDLMVLHRGPNGSWLGHVALVARVAGDRVVSVEANHGLRVAEVARDMRAPKTRLAFFASLRR